MKARISYGLLLATALAVAIVVVGCGGGSVVSNGGSEPAVLNAELEGAEGTFPDYEEIQGEEVWVVAEAPDTATSVQATIEGPPGEPLPDGGTITLLETPSLTPPMTHGRGFDVPAGATTGTVYEIRVTANTPSGPVQSDLMTLTVIRSMPPPPPF